LDMVETSVTEVGGNKLYVSLHVHTQNCRAIVFSPEESPCSPMTTTTLMGSVISGPDGLEDLRCSARSRSVPLGPGRSTCTFSLIE
jgi:hypothetical protein